MARWIVAGLVVLNLMLGAGLWMRLGEKSAQAQIGGGRGDYATVSGSSGGQAIVYILESTTGRLVAIRTDPVNRKVDVLDGRQVAQDLAKMR